MADQLEKVPELLPDETLSPLEIIALSDKSLSQRWRGFVGLEMTKYFRDDWLHNVIGALVFGGIYLLFFGLDILALASAIIGACAVFLAKTVISVARAPSEIDKAIRARNERCLRALADLTRHKLFLKVNTDPFHMVERRFTYSGGYISPMPVIVGYVPPSGGSVATKPSETDFRLELTLYAKFHNKDTFFGRVASVLAQLILADGQVLPVEIRPLVKGHNEKVNDLRIEPRRESEEYALICDGRIHIDKKPLLTSEAYVRLTMDADGQRPYCVDLTMDWESAWNPNGGSVPVRLIAEGEC